ncbi:hypothetical protein ACCO45_000898 [Purpureocillium lilacinum]|uniref:Uncharacterized protein n=1 Tax=Purpureocillium lilacinum TaxID=33203 RepID=A0ACC4E6X5_PURLI
MSNLFSGMASPALCLELRKLRLKLRPGCCPRVQTPPLGVWDGSPPAIRLLASLAAGAADASQKLLRLKRPLPWRVQQTPGQQKSPSPSTAGPPAAPSPDNLSQASQSSTNLAPKVPPLPNSPSLAQTIGMDESSGYIKHIVKGNFMTLSARPKTVEQGEWIAHQIVEHYRNLWNFVRVVHEKEDNGTSICNATSCPRMSAGGQPLLHLAQQGQEPVELPAYEYMTLMQRWISGKIDDTNIFPTDATGVSYAHNPAITTTPLSQLLEPW